MNPSARAVQAAAGRIGGVSWDIHSYFEVRDGGESPWRLVHRPAAVDGRLDVPEEDQPLGGIRSSPFFSALTGICSIRARLDVSSFEPIVPEDREPPRDLSPELSAVYAGWEGPGTTPPYALTLAEVAAIDWTGRTVRYEDEPDPVPLEDVAGALQDLIPAMRDLAAGRRPEDVRLVFWLDG